MYLCEIMCEHNSYTETGLSLKIEEEGRNKKVEGGSGGLAYSYTVFKM